MRSKRQIYERIAPYYDLLDLPAEYFRYRTIRAHLFRGLNGRILDAGVGTGRNIEFYPENSEVVGIDLSPSMLERARKRRDRSAANVELLEMDVLSMPFSDGEFDAVVSTFMFCVLDDELQLPALRELKRVCRSSGEIRLLEYSLPRAPLHRFTMKYIWGPWVRWAYGAAFDRNTEQYCAAAGLEIIDSQHLYRDIIKMICLRHAA